MLSLLLFLPLIGILLLIPMGENQINLMKKISLRITILRFIVSLIIWNEFDSSSIQYQFVEEFNKLEFCHFYIGIDGISLYFILLTTFITPFCILSNWENIQFKIKYFLIAFLLIETLLIRVFTVLDFMLFYIFFESVLIPIFLVVGIWGGSKNSIRASYLLFLYTLRGSLFILLRIIRIYYNFGTTDFNIISLSSIDFHYQKILWLIFFLSFSVKTPLYPFHIWLPRRHREAPVRGSVLLAGVFLKLATYGFLRILINFMPESSFYFSPLIQIIRIITIIYSSIATVRQSDFKALVAYSSVRHIGVVVLGLFSNSIIGIEGAILLSVRHGFVSPRLFILVGSVLYDRFHTRIIRYYRGITMYMPIFSLFFFIFTRFNIGIPLSLNWIGEFISLSGRFQKNPLRRIFASLSIILSASYSIFLFNKIRFGSYSKFLSFSIDINRREFRLLFPLLLITFLLGIFPNIILNDIHSSVSELLYSL